MDILPSDNSVAVCSIHQRRHATAFQDAELVNQLRSLNSSLSETESFSNRANAALSQLNQTITQVKVRQLKQKAIAQQVWDFYPTPTAVIDKMLEVAHLQPHHHVLEPSAGSGDLVRAIALAGVERVDCFEIHPLLRQALQLQQFNLIGFDFLMAAPNPIYDRVIANPPFGNNGVANHTIHGYNFLKPGGRLVTIAHHYKLSPSQCDRYFFDWLKGKNARFKDLGSAFQECDRNTQMPVQLITIDKPLSTRPLPNNHY